MRRTPDSAPSGIWAPLVLTGAVLVLERVEGPAAQYIGVLTAMPLLAAALAGPLSTAFVSSVVLLAAFVMGYVETDQLTGLPAAETTAQNTRLGFILAAGVLGVVVSRTRTLRAQQFRRIAGVADAAQSAILRPVPPTVGPLDCASVYVSATSEASIGGDLVEVLDTPFGVRAIVGDVRGKGLDAVRLAGQVLGSFREVAWTVADLRDVALPLDRAVRRDAGPEDFVTAVLVQLTWDGVLTTCSCGHPAPLVVDGSGTPARTLDVEPAPPLGMLTSAPAATTDRLSASDRLVLVTDGLLEARRPRRLLDRRSGQFLPAEEVLGTSLASGPLSVGLQRTVAAVRQFTRDRLRDDLALLALQIRPSGPRRSRRRP
ncbi:MAG: PP2C family protein-serine/threonine phosphatase [Actinomycetes bacterium]